MLNSLNDTIYKISTSAVKSFLPSVISLMSVVILMSLNFTNWFRKSGAASLSNFIILSSKGLSVLKVFNMVSLASAMLAIKKLYPSFFISSISKNNLKTADNKNLLLANRIKNIRTSNKLSQRQFAKHLKVNRRTVARWESGVHKPKQDHLSEIAKLAGKGIIWLLYNEDYSS